MIISTSRYLGARTGVRRHFWFEQGLEPELGDFVPQFLTPYSHHSAFQAWNIPVYKPLKTLSLNTLPMATCRSSESLLVHHLQHDSIHRY